MAVSFASAFACESDEMECNGQCYKTFEFTVSSSSGLSFYITAAGTFCVDWGGTAGIVDVSRTSVENALNANSTVTAPSGTGTTIKIAGKATGYSTTTTIPAISFNTTNAKQKLTGISGSLGAIFPTLDSTSVANAGTSPSFYQTFYAASNLTGTLPANLFAGVTDPSENKFSYTFYNCSKLYGDVPATLFPNLKGTTQSNMFYRTFYGCSNLGKDAVNGNTTYYIHPETFRGLIYKSGGMSYTFYQTGLKSACPSGTTEYTYYKTTAEKYDEPKDSSTTGNWPTNTYSSSSVWGRVSCIASGSIVCLDGEYRDSGGACALCPTGTYCTDKPTIFSTNNSGATECPIGTYNPNTGSTNASACLSCAAGTYNNLTGQSACTQCDANTYNPDTGSTSALACLACPANTTSPAGSTSVSDCVSQSSCPGGMPKYNGTCAVACNGLEYLKTNNVSIPVFGNKLTTHAIHVSYNGNDCYVPMESGSGSNTINMQHGNDQYHAVIVQ